MDAYPVNYPPIGVVAPIASIEAVLADPSSELEARISEHYGDTCVVEMEGYGAVFAACQERTPSIVVRGVSDMTQAKTPEKDATLQPIAASHAAAFGFEILSHWGQIYKRRTAPSPARYRPFAQIHPAPPVPGSESAPADAVPTCAPDMVLNLDIDDQALMSDHLSHIEGTLRELGASEDIISLWRLSLGDIRTATAM